MSDYERIRYDRLKHVITKAVDQTVNKSLMAEQVAQCFPTISATPEGRKALETARALMVRYFHDTCINQFDHTLEKRDLKQKLNELDEIIQSAQRRRDLGLEEPLHVDELTAEQLIGASIGPAKEDALKNLQYIHHQLVLDNQQLFDELLELAKEGEKEKASMDQAIEALSKGINELKRQEFDAQLDALLMEVFGS